jgi:hypothetical protein
VRIGRAHLVRVFDGGRLPALVAPILPSYAPNEFVRSDLETDPTAGHSTTDCKGDLRRG